MFLLVKFIKDIDKFSVNKKHIAFTYVNLPELYLNFEIIVDDCSGFYFFEDYFVYNTNKSKTVFTNLKTKQKTILQITVNGFNFFNNTFIISKNSVREGRGLYTSNFVLCQLFPFKELYELPNRYFGSGNRFENNLIQTESNKLVIKYLSLLTGEYTWQTNLETFGEIVDIIGVVENTLWVWLTKDQLIGIDINNGVIPNNYKPLQQLSQIVEGFVFNKHFIEKEQSLYFFHRSYLIKVNLENNTTTLLWENQNYNIGLSVFTDDFIYFIGGKNQGVFKNGIGIFCRKTNQVIWETTFELNDYVVLKDIQYGDNKIYVLDTAGDLRIFEKEV